MEPELSTEITTDELMEHHLVWERSAPTPTVLQQLEGRAWYRARYSMNIIPKEDMVEL